MEYQALRDFKFRPSFRKDTVFVKKGETIVIENNKDFPDVENKMLELNYVRPKKGQ